MRGDPASKEEMEHAEVAERQTHQGVHDKIWERNIQSYSVPDGREPHNECSHWNIVSKCKLGLTPAFSTPPFSTVPRCPLPRFQSLGYYSPQSCGCGRQWLENDWCTIFNTQQIQVDPKQRAVVLQNCFLKTFQWSKAYWISSKRHVIFATYLQNVTNLACKIAKVTKWFHKYINLKSLWWTTKLKKATADFTKYWFYV